jgi:peptidoglycan/xylan/chitin deacetylase (PgdA/CDA1 family)
MNRKIIIPICILFFFVGIIPVSSAVQYTCCKNFTISNGTLISGFNISSEWTLTSVTTSAKGSNTQQYIEGNSSLYLNTGNQSAAVARADIDISFSSNETIGYWVYSDNWSKVSAIKLQFHTDRTTSEANMSSYTYNEGTEFSNVATNDSGWMFMENNFKYFTFVGNATPTSRYLRVRIKVYSHSTSDPANVSWDNLVYGYRAKPQFFFDFDDGLSSFYNLSYPVMKANGQRGTAFIITDNIDSPTGLSLNTSSLHDLYNNGWDIGSHTQTTDALDTLNNTSIIATLNNSYDILYNMGFTRSSQFFAYPQGKYSDNIINLTKKRYLISRTVNYEVSNAPVIQSFDPDTMHMRQSVYGSDGRSPENVMDEINNTIARNGSMHFLVHGVQNEVPSYALNYNLSNFSVISNYVASKQADGSLDVLTYSDLTISSNVISPGSNQYSSWDSPTISNYQSAQSFSVLDVIMVLVLFLIILVAVAMSGDMLSLIALIIIFIIVISIIPSYRGA